MEEIVIHNTRGETFFKHQVDEQTLLWLEDKQIPLQSLHKIFLNKVLYFSAKELDAKIGGSWYLFGPYAWRGPVEGENSYVNLVESMRKRTLIDVKVKIKPIEKIQKVLDYLGGIYFIENKAPATIFRFLDKVYSEKQEYPQLKRFYLQKNATEASYYDFINSKKTSQELAKEIKRYEAEIFYKQYQDMIKLPQEVKMLLIDFFAGLIENLESDTNRPLQLKAFDFQEQKINRQLCSYNSKNTAESFSEEDKKSYIENKKRELVKLLSEIKQGVSDFNTTLYLHKS